VLACDRRSEDADDGGFTGISDTWATLRAGRFGCHVVQIVANGCQRVLTKEKIFALQHRYTKENDEN
jgi:hypothetical protein